MIDISASFAFWTRPKSPTRSPSQSWGHFAGLTLSLLVLFLIAVLTSPAHAEVSLRIAEPISEPVTIRVKVTDENGIPVTNLSTGDFQVTVDGNPPGGITFERPARDDPSQRVSVIFVMDYSESIVPDFEQPMVEATQNFIDAMEDGDYAGILKFSGKEAVKLVAPLQEITDAATRQDLKDKAAEDPKLGGSTALWDGIKRALDEFKTQLDAGALPPGPKAMILVSDGVEKDSSARGRAVTDFAKSLGVSVFAVGVGPADEIVRDANGNETGVTGEQLLIELATQTGGTYQFSPDDAGIQQIYTDVSDSLLNEYLLTFAYGIAACQDYTIQVTVEGYDPVSKDVSSECAQPPRQSSGGGAFGPLGLIAGLSLLALRRRLRAG